MFPGGPGRRGHWQRPAARPRLLQVRGRLTLPLTLTLTLTLTLSLCLPLPLPLTRYAGGLLGEAALRQPYRKALGLASGSPKRLSFDFGISPTSTGSTTDLEPLPSLERLYDAFDEAGDAAGTDEARAAIVKEAAAAMRCNLHLHQEGIAQA